MPLYLIASETSPLYKPQFSPDDSLHFVFFWLISFVLRAACFDLCLMLDVIGV